MVFGTLETKFNIVALHGMLFFFFFRAPLKVKDAENPRRNVKLRLNNETNIKRLVYS